MSTYRDVACEVKISGGFTPKTCWIAHVLEILGVKLRRTPNRINPEVRKHSPA
jgi:hypothetical protein